MAKRREHFRAVVHLLAMLVVALFVFGCGGAYPEASGAAPAPDRDADGIAAESDVAPEDAEEAMLDEKLSAMKEAPSGAVAQAAPPPAPPGAPPRAPDAQKPDAPATPPGTGPDAPPGSGAGAGGEKTIAGPLLIYSANIQVAVFETKKAMDAAEKIARESGGYLVRRDDTTIVFRVPAGKFEKTLDDSMKLGDVLKREVSVRDVTEEFFDLQIRVRNLEAMRDRLEDLLKRAQKVEEALAVERELERVAGQIERLKGRVKLLKELIAFSTITIVFQARATDQVDSTIHLPFPWLQQLGLADLLRL
jgi:hypothetical protein